MSSPTNAISKVLGHPKAPRLASETADDGPKDTSASTDIAGLSSSSSSCSSGHKQQVLSHQFPPSTLTVPQARPDPRGLERRLQREEGISKMVSVTILKRLYDDLHSKRHLNPQPKDGIECQKWEGAGARLSSWAAYLFGFSCLLRTDEILKMEAEDVKKDSENAIIITLPRKRQQYDEVETFYLYALPEEQAHLCPVRAYMAWMSASPINTGYLFPKIGAGDPLATDKNESMADENEQLKTSRGVGARWMAVERELRVASPVPFGASAIHNTALLHPPTLPNKRKLSRKPRRFSADGNLRLKFGRRTLSIYWSTNCTTPVRPGQVPNPIVDDPFGSRLATHKSRICQDPRRLLHPLELPTVHLQSPQRPLSHSRRTPRRHRERLLTSLRSAAHPPPALALLDNLTTCLSYDLPELRHVGARTARAALRERRCSAAARAPHKARPDAYWEGRVRVLRVRPGEGEREEEGWPLFHTRLIHTLPLANLVHLTNTALLTRLTTDYGAFGDRRRCILEVLTEARWATTGTWTWPWIIMTPSVTEGLILQDMPTEAWRVIAGTWTWSSIVDWVVVIEGPGDLGPFYLLFLDSSCLPIPQRHSFLLFHGAFGDRRMSLQWRLRANPLRPCSQPIFDWVEAGLRSSRGYSEYSERAVFFHSHAWLNVWVEVELPELARQLVKTFTTARTETPSILGTLRDGRGLGIQS
ncbi:hypothetical protein K438DRAFT_1779463 [Mycena galopus ATCC 62051]|nr:hypothetical protein K438DRAFT_1779463 [Mycena galopus ATCC 62051]